MNQRGREYLHPDGEKQAGGSKRGEYLFAGVAGWGKTSEVAGGLLKTFLGRGGGGVGVGVSPGIMVVRQANRPRVQPDRWAECSA